jgi:hypothetical protein
MSRMKITVIETLFNNDVGGRRNRMGPVLGRYRPRVQLPIKAAKRQVEQQLTPPLPEKISKKVSTASKPNENSIRVRTARPNSVVRLMKDSQAGRHDIRFASTNGIRR